LVALENTHNMAGGGVFPQEQYESVVDFAHQSKLRVHLDGARLFNAAAATGSSARQLAGKADSIMFCLSKGLAAPAGSLLAGDRDFIEEAVQVRKRMGGGMRQVGILAGAGLVALNTMLLRLAEDHHHAKLLAGRLAEIPGVEIDPEEVETNIIIFKVRTGLASELAERLEREGVLCLSVTSDKIRMVTHLDVTRSQVLTAAEQVGKLVAP
jgi:threonine aldolase